VPQKKRRNTDLFLQGRAVAWGVKAAGGVNRNKRVLRREKSHQRKRVGIGLRLQIVGISKGTGPKKVPDGRERRGGGEHEHWFWKAVNRASESAQKSEGGAVTIYTGQ